MIDLAEQLVADHQLKPVHEDLVQRGIITEAELQVARALRQTFYNPQNRRFAVITPYTTKNGQNKAAVVYLEPPKAPLNKLSPHNFRDYERQRLA